MLLGAAKCLADAQPWPKRTCLVLERASSDDDPVPNSEVHGLPCLLQLMHMEAAHRRDKDQNGSDGP